eukprot:GHVQ01017955.1.p1 GENE.GHVQ01017955.1~~GHVQ01017955.1.p1  ORF type:complete len:1876 (+),score=382.13 GHVQ01017955.1:228-5855(+)
MKGFGANWTDLTKQLTTVTRSAVDKAGELAQQYKQRVEDSPKLSSAQPRHNTEPHPPDSYGVGSSLQTLRAVSNSVNLFLEDESDRVGSNVNTTFTLSSPSRGEDDGILSTKSAPLAEDTPGSSSTRDRRAGSNSRMSRDRLEAALKASIQRNKALKTEIETLQGQYDSSEDNLKEARLLLDTVSHSESTEDLSPREQLLKKQLSDATGWLNSVKQEHKEVTEQAQKLSEEVSELSCQNENLKKQTDHLLQQNASLTEQNSRLFEDHATLNEQNQSLQEKLQEDTSPNISKVLMKGRSLVEEHQDDRDLTLMRSENDKLTRQIEKMQIESLKDKNQIIRQRDTASLRGTKLEEEREVLSRRLSVNFVELEAVKQKHSEVEERYQNLLQANQGDTEAQQNLREELASLKKANAAFNDSYSSLKQEVLEVAKQVQRNVQCDDDPLRRVHEVLKEIHRLRAEANELSSVVESVKAENDKLKEELHDSDEERDEHRDKVSESNRKGKGTKDNRDVTDEDLRETEISLEERATHAETESNRLRQQLEDLEGAARQRDALEATLKQVEGQAKLKEKQERELEDLAKTLEGTAKDLRHQLEVVKEENNSLRASVDIAGREVTDAVEKQIEDLQMDLREKEQLVSQQRVIITELESKKKEADAVAVMKHAETMSRLERELENEKETRLKELEKERDSRLKLDQSVEKLTSELEAAAEENTRLMLKVGDYDNTVGLVSSLERDKDELKEKYAVTVEELENTKTALERTAQEMELKEQERKEALRKEDENRGQQTNDAAVAGAAELATGLKKIAELQAAFDETSTEKLKAESGASELAEQLDAALSTCRELEAFKEECQQKIQIMETEITRATEGRDAAETSSKQIRKKLEDIERENTEREDERRELDRDKMKLTERLSAVELEKERLEACIEESRSAVERREAEAARERQRCEELESSLDAQSKKIRSDEDDATRELVIARTRIEALEREKNEGAAEMARRMDKSKTEIDELKQRLESLQREKQDSEMILKRRVSGIEKEMSRQTQAQSSLTGEQGSRFRLLEENLSHAQTQLEDVEREKRTLEERLADAESCRTVLENSMKTSLEEAQVVATEERRRYELLSERLEEESKSKKEVEVSLEKQSLELESRLNDAEAKLQATSNGRSSLQSELSELHEKYNSLEAKWTTAERSTVEKANELEQIERETSEAIRKHLEAERAREEAERAREEAERAREEASKSWQTAEASLKEKEETVVRISAENLALSSQLEDARTLMEKNDTEIRRELRTQIEETAHTHAAALTAHTGKVSAMYETIEELRQENQTLNDQLSATKSSEQVVTDLGAKLTEVREEVANLKEANATVRKEKATILLKFKEHAQNIQNKGESELQTKEEELLKATSEVKEKAETVKQMQAQNQRFKGLLAQANKRLEEQQSTITSLDSLSQASKANLASMEKEYKDPPQPCDIQSLVAGVQVDGVTWYCVRRGRNDAQDVGRICWWTESDLPEGVHKPRTFQQHQSETEHYLKSQIAELEKEAQALREQLASTNTVFDGYRAKAQMALQQTAAQVEQLNRKEHQNQVLTAEHLKLKTLNERLESDKSRFNDQLNDLERQVAEQSAMRTQLEGTLASFRLKMDRQKEQLRSELKLAHDKQIAEQQRETERKWETQRAEFHNELRRNIEEVEQVKKDLENESKLRQAAETALRECGSARQQQQKHHATASSLSPSTALPPPPPPTPNVDASGSSSGNRTPKISSERHESQSTGDEPNDPRQLQCFGSFGNIAPAPWEDVQKIRSDNRELEKSLLDERNNSKLLTEMNECLKQELRKTEQKQEMSELSQKPTNMEYLRNIVVKFLETDTIGSSRKRHAVGYNVNYAFMIH